MIVRAAWLIAYFIAVAVLIYAVVWIVTHLGGSPSIWSG